MGEGRPEVSGPGEACPDPADRVTTTALLNCLVRELAADRGSADVGSADGCLLLPATGRSIGFTQGRWPHGPVLMGAAGPEPLTPAGLVHLVEQELRARTGVDNTALASEIADSRDVVRALLAARESAAPVADPFLRSEQALVAGHRYHPAAKTRGGGPAEHWLPYAPEAHASFPLTLLGVREELLAGTGDSSAMDRLWGDRAPDGYRILPAHPWQLRLLDDRAELHDGRLLVLGTTAERAWATSSIRTVYLPEADLFLKFSLDVRITNDIRRLWLRDLRWLGPVDELLVKAFADAPDGASVLSDTGYRTVATGGDDAHEAFAVLLRDGLGAGPRPLLAAGISEGFPGNPLDGLTTEVALRWWRRYVEQVVPPVLHAYLEHGVVLESHLQNVLVGMDEDGLPTRSVFRDHEGVKLLTERHGELLARQGPTAATPGVGAEYGWQRLVYCLLTNHLLEIAGAVAERHPELTASLWPCAREVFLAWADHPEVRGLLDSATVPAKTNLLLRWTDADGGDSTFTPLANPLRCG